MRAAWKVSKCFLHVSFWLGDLGKVVLFAQIFEISLSWFGGALCPEYISSGLRNALQRRGERIECKCRAPRSEPRGQESKEPLSRLFSPLGALPPGQGGLLVSAVPASDLTESTKPGGMG